MNGFEEYQRLMLDHAVLKIRQILATDRKKMEEVNVNHLFNLPGPRRLDQRLTREESLFGQLWYGFNEIAGSYQTLKDLASLPIAGTKLAPVQYIRMNIECYLAEVYILQERLLRYLNVIGKATRASTTSESYKQVRDIAPRLKKVIYKTLERICGVRGSHIHEARYDDEDLSRLGSLELLVNAGHMTELRSYYRRECREVRKKWHKIISGNNHATAALLDVYFDKLNPVVFSLESSLLGLPKNSSQPLPPAH
jgi:hypothetical protein